MTSNAHPSHWFASTVGRRCLAAERRVLRQALDKVFGEQLIQIGDWGGRGAFLPYARTRRAALLDDAFGGEADLISDSGNLALASESIDAVLLPHTLERCESPHALLRECERVLRADGYLIALGFSAGGAWGLRDLMSVDGYPHGRRRRIGERRLRDWLKLLGFEAAKAEGYCHALPFERLSWPDGSPKERWARRWLPFLAGGYLLVAQKRVRVLTPFKPAWRRPPRLRAVGGLVEPTTRASRGQESP